MPYETIEFDPGRYLPVRGEGTGEADAHACECYWTPEDQWLSAASCGYGSGYEPGSQREWNPDCPAHPPTTPTGDGTLGTVDQPETTSTGTDRPRARRAYRKPYNLRLDTAVVAEAMDQPASGDLSLAQLVERLLVEFNEREA